MIICMDTRSIKYCIRMYIRILPPSYTHAIHVYLGPGIHHKNNAFPLIRLPSCTFFPLPFLKFLVESTGPCGPRRGAHHNLNVSQTFLALEERKTTHVFLSWTETVQRDKPDPGPSRSHRSCISKSDIAPPGAACTTRRVMIRMH